MSDANKINRLTRGALGLTAILAGVLSLWIFCLWLVLLGSMLSDFAPSFRPAAGQALTVGVLYLYWQVQYAPKVVAYLGIFGWAALVTLIVWNQRPLSEIPGWVKLVLVGATVVVMSWDLGRILAMPVVICAAALLVRCAIPSGRGSQGWPCQPRKGAG